jgi:hypothetical protein
MINKQTRPMFKPMPLPQGGGWRVEVHWPNGTTQHVDAFHSDYQACDFIFNRSAAWLLKHSQPAQPERSESPEVPEPRALTVFDAAP